MKLASRGTHDSPKQGVLAKNRLENALLSFLSLQLGNYRRTRIGSHSLLLGQIDRSGHSVDNFSARLSIAKRSL